MNVQDFFSIVQLGVGIHAGTAILQLSGELGVSPVERRLSNISSWLEQENADEALLDEIREDMQIEKTNLIVYKAQYANAYRLSVNLNFAFGALLAVVLVFMSFLASSSIGTLLALILVLLCFLPATLIFCWFWHVSNEALLPIRDAVSRLEAKIRAPR
jgi:hypothetical protein